MILKCKDGSLIDSRHIASYYVEGTTLKARIYNGWTDLGKYNSSEDAIKELIKIERLLKESGAYIYSVG